MPSGYQARQPGLRHAGEKRTQDRQCSNWDWSHTGPTSPEKVRAGTYNACSDQVRRQGPEPRTRGLRVRCSVRLFVLNCCPIMLARAGNCHSVRPPGISGALRVPDAAGAYRGVRATMEKPPILGGLDHLVANVGGNAGRRSWYRRQGYRRPARQVICDPGPARAVGSK